MSLFGRLMPTLSEFRHRPKRWRESAFDAALRSVPRTRSGARVGMALGLRHALVGSGVRREAGVPGVCVAPPPVRRARAARTRGAGWLLACGRGRGVRSARPLPLDVRGAVRVRHAAAAVAASASGRCTAGGQSIRFDVAVKQRTVAAMDLWPDGRTRWRSWRGPSGLDPRRGCRCAVLVVNGFG